MVSMDPLPIVLPTVSAPPRRQSLPLLAASMPIVSGVALWLITGSMFALCFAALGPLMMLASLADAARGRRREKRRSDAETDAAWQRAEATLAKLHSAELQRLRALYPDAAAALVEAPLRGVGVDSHTLLTVGAGEAASMVRTSGGEGERARAFQERSRVVSDAPVRVPLGTGVCLRGPEPVAMAVARALVVQLCLRFAPGQLTLVGDRLEHLGFAALPHVGAASAGGSRVRVGAPGDRRVAAQSFICVTTPGGDVPEGITTVLDLEDPGRAILRTPEGSSEIAVECLSRDQLDAVARGQGGSREPGHALPATLSSRDLVQTASPTGLPAAIGRTVDQDAVVDIVEDGPHAIVTGTTGTGKSELLVTWVTAIATAHGPDRVNFVLADFKGGTAFEPLRQLRQVAAVITDLDEHGARRGVSSLTAELRRREAALAAAGVRDIRDLDMPRLVIVVDEFAALLNEHPDLGAVFTDIAARGRALGMHLILGTQRASGVIRDALAANCPLRLSLRVADAADSRLVVGTDAAAELPGGGEGRGLAVLRRPQDSDPVPLRIALTDAAQLHRTGVRWQGEARPRSPWLPPLPEKLSLAEVEAAEPAKGASEGVAWGRADDPATQSQPVLRVRVGEERGIVIVGAARSGRTAALRALRRQVPDSLWIPRDPEAMWDTVATLAEGAATAPRLVLCDDLDARVAELPVEHAQMLLQRWEQILRSSPETTFVMSAMRPSGPVGRVLEALPLRALLHTGSRVEHLAAGGETSGFDPTRPPGRARMGQREIQIVWTDPATSADDTAPVVPHWKPPIGITGLVSPSPAALAQLLQSTHAGCEVVLVGGSGGDERARQVREQSKPIVLVGDADSWQREWSLWQRIRAEGEMLFRAERAVDLRQLGGTRELPPYCRPHAGRAWVVRGGDQPRRVLLPWALPRPDKVHPDRSGGVESEPKRLPAEPATRRQRRHGLI
jgi:S-DNA-T family DNA segregation ATPase FtsK/SpoIIIE